MYSTRRTPRYQVARHSGVTVKVITADLGRQSGKMKRERQKSRQGSKKPTLSQEQEEAIISSKPGYLQACIPISIVKTGLSSQDARCHKTSCLLRIFASWQFRESPLLNAASR